MKTVLRRTPLVIAFIVLALGIWFLKAAEMRFSLPPEISRLTAGSGSDLATAQCLLCHSADYISTQPRLSRATWKATVLKMQQKYGAPIQTNSVDQLVEYLTKNYGNEAAEFSTPQGK